MKEVESLLPEQQELTKEEQIKKQEHWVNFLKRRLKSVQDNCDVRTYKKEKVKYDQAKYKLKMLKDG